jgi:hypothetical protein
MDRIAAQAFVRTLNLRLEEVAACALCLLNVAWALRDGNERKIRSAVRFHAPILWDEGLDTQVRVALERARAAGLAGAEAALADVKAREDRSHVVLEIVRHLAAQQLDEMERDYITSMN